jgi:hypothetical protein
MDKFLIKSSKPAKRKADDAANGGAPAAKKAKVDDGMASAKKALTVAKKAVKSAKQPLPDLFSIPAPKQVWLLPQEVRDELLAAADKYKGVTNKSLGEVIGFAAVTVGK